MSRIGRNPIPVPAGVTIEMTDGHVKVSGPKGTLERDLPRDITIRQDEGVLLVERPTDQRLDPGTLRRRTRRHHGSGNSEQ